MAAANARSAESGSGDGSDLTSAEAGAEVTALGVNAWSVTCSSNSYVPVETKSEVGENHSASPDPDTGPRPPKSA